MPTRIFAGHCMAGAGAVRRPSPVGPSMARLIHPGQQLGMPADMMCRRRQQAALNTTTSHQRIHSTMGLRSAQEPEGREEEHVSGRVHLICLCTIYFSPRQRCPTTWQARMDADRSHRRRLPPPLRRSCTELRRPCPFRPPTRRRTSTPTTGCLSPSWTMAAAAAECRSRPDNRRRR
jgi:hypothetical protein